MSEDTLKRHGTRPYQVACAVLFLVFTFCYLYFYQDNLLAMGQYVLSKGRTHYDHMVGAVLLTLFLWLLQIGCYLLFRLKGRSHALTYMPSVVCLPLLRCAMPAGRRPTNRLSTAGKGFWAVGHGSTTAVFWCSSSSLRFVPITTKCSTRDWKSNSMSWMAHIGRH